MLFWHPVFSCKSSPCPDEARSGSWLPGRLQEDSRPARGFPQKTCLPQQVQVAGSSIHLWLSYWSGKISTWKYFWSTKRSWRWGGRMLKKRSQSFSALFRCVINRTILSIMLCGWTTKSGWNTPTSQDFQRSNIHLQRSGGELLLENTQHDGDAFFEAEKVTLTASFGKISRLERYHVC